MRNSTFWGICILGDGGCGRRRDFIWKWHVPGGTETTDVSAMFVLDAEESPDAPAKDFGESDEEAEKGRML